MINMLQEFRLSVATVILRYFIQEDRKILGIMKNFTVYVHIIILISLFTKCQLMFHLTYKSIKQL